MSEEYVNPDSEATEHLETVDADTADATGGELTSDAMVDNMIAGLLTDEEKGQLKGQPDEEPEPEPEKAEAPEPEKEEKFLVDGKEITLDELKGGYLRQSDYTRKTQELANERQTIARHAVLVEHLDKNPQDYNKVVEALKQGLTPTEAVQEAEQVPDDPIDAITHNATQEALKQTGELVGGVRTEIDQLKLLQAQERVKLAVQNDPLAEQTRNSMAEYAMGEYKELNGEDAANKFLAGLDSDPNLFVKYYTHHRKKVEASQEKPPEKVVSREKKVPFVADSDSATPIVPKEKKKRRELKALREKTKGGRVEDVVNFIEAAGMVEHLS